MIDSLSHSAKACSLAMAKVGYSNSDWLVVLFTSVVIGQSNYFGFGSMTPLYDRKFESFG